MNGGRARDKSKVYVDNTAFFNAMVEYLDKKEAAERAGTPPPKITNYIGECILNIATRLASLSNFNRYTYKDEMISDAIEKCIMYLHNFDPEKSKNPFAYFTQIVYYSFMNRISIEKKQSYGMYKMMLNKVHFEGMYQFNEGPGSDSGEFLTQMINNSDLDVSSMEEFVDKYEKKNIIKKEKERKSKKRVAGLTEEL